MVEFNSMCVIMCNNRRNVKKEKTLGWELVDNVEF